MSQIIRSKQKLIGVFIIMVLVHFALEPHYVDLVDQLSLMFPHGSQHTEPLSIPNFCGALSVFLRRFPRVKTFPLLGHPPPPSAAAHLHILRRSFFLQLSHKDGIKKVENTSALAFSLQAIGMIWGHKAATKWVSQHATNWSRHSPWVTHIFLSAE